MNFIERILFAPFNVQMVITRQCNLACEYCNEFDKNTKPVKMSQIAKQISVLKKLGTWSLTLTGGEPLLHEHIMRIIKIAKKNISVVGIITNGFLLTKKKILEFNGLGLNMLQISIDFVSENKQSRKSLEQLETKLLLLKHFARFKVVVNTVLGAGNIGQSIRLTEYCFNNGLFQTYGIKHDGEGQMCLDAYEREDCTKVFALPRNKPWWDIVCFEKKLVKNGKARFKCRAGSRYLYIDEFGNVEWCSQKRNKLKKPLIDYTIKDLRTQFYAPKPCSAQCTIGCVRRAGYFDSWRRQIK
ncbi:radical SAM protein [Candidatus Woesearchaeota archaeon]|nr:radical SAM protein [Candidatus Woesearchaeota archaeon]